MSVAINRSGKALYVNVFCHLYVNVFVICITTVMKIDASAAVTLLEQRPEKIQALSGI